MNRTRSGHLVLRMPLDVAVLPLMRSRVRTYLRQDGMEEECVEDVVLCVQEACKNAIRFSGSSDGILLRLSRESGTLYVLVRDHGVGLAPDVLAVTPTPMDEHGRGLQIIRRLMDSVEVRADGGTELLMVKHAPGTAGAGRLALSA